MFLHSGVEGEVELCKYISSVDDFYVVSFDHAGHGRSATDNERGHVDNFECFIQDALTVIRDTMSKLVKWKNLPFFLFGNSLGGCIALNTGIRVQDLECFLGAILVAPAIYDNIRPEAWVVDTLRTINYLGGGVLPLGPAVDRSHFPNDEAFERFKSDKYCYSGRLKLSLGNSLLCLTEHTQKVIKDVSYPYCLLHSKDDPIVKVEGSRELYKVCKTPHGSKVYYEYRNHGHNVLMAPCALSKSFLWVEKRLNKWYEEQELKKVAEEICERLVPEDGPQATVANTQPPADVGVAIPKPSTDNQESTEPSPSQSITLT
uniref:Serine aminopeptidase S33 domain-containing protein n=1 Tax=Arcella intermedia TaxID=1963864 RepID=A0A6B2L8P0_9EUKA